MASTDLFLLDLEHDKDAICCRGVDRSGAFRALRITGFRPHFYWGPVETSGDAADDAAREAALRAAAGDASVRVSNVSRVALAGHGAPQTYRRVSHACATPQSAVVKAAARAFRGDAGAGAVEDGLPVCRRFLAETRLSGGSWLRCAAPPPADNSQWTAAWRDVEGLCPDILADAPAAPEEPLPELRAVAVRVEAASGRDDTWMENQKTDDAVALVAVAVAGGACVVHAHAPAWRGAAARLGGGVEVRRYGSEAGALRGFEAHLLDLDPDVVLSFDNRALGLLGERFETVVGRRPRLARGKRDSAGWRVKSVTTYSKDWIKSRSEGGRRMASSNNLETHRLDGVEGRACLDLLRFVSMRATPKLTRYTLAEASRALLDAAPPTVGPAARAGLAAPRRAALAAAEARTVLALAAATNCVAETFETARATGLDLDTVSWRAASVRSEQLLLRASRSFGAALPLKRPAPVMRTPWAADTTPFLYHPSPLAELQPHQVNLVESGLMGHGGGTAGFYEDPVVVLDFASLYPSVFIAHNVCYTTLASSDGARAHETPTTRPDDRELWGFVGADARDGLVPRTLRALLRARKAAKAGARAAAAAGDRRLADCLDARQLSLKMCANATYGYTGSDVSSLEGKPLAEACVRWGNAYCRRAIALVEDGTFPGARVVYSQTDSVFVVLPGRGHAAAADEGRRIAAHVSRNLPEALTLEYEHALRPFILLHVNRYGGCTADGSMLLKGVASQRGSCAFVKKTLRGVAEALLLPGRGGVAGACAFAARRVDALLAGDVDAGELELGAFLWRVDHGDLDRLSRGAKTREDVDALRTPHVALAARTLRKEPLKRYRLGEFVPSLVSRGCKGDAQNETVADPEETLVNETPVDLRLYYDKKLRPELERLLAPFAGDPAVTALFARALRASPGVLATREDAKALFQGAASSSTAAPPSPPRAQTLRDRFLLAGPGKDDRCVRCERPTEDDARRAAFCGPCFRAAPGARATCYLDLLACQRALDREVCALRRARDAAARAGAVPAGAVSDHAPRLCNALRRLRAVDAKLGRAFDAPPEASPPPPPPPRKKKRQRSAPRADLDGSRRSLFPAADAPPPAPAAGAWACDFCTYVHAEPAEFDFLACTVCGAQRPKKAAKNAKAAPPRTP